MGYFRDDSRRPLSDGDENELATFYRPLRQQDGLALARFGDADARLSEL